MIQDKYPYTRKACLSVCTQVKTSELCGCNTRRIEYKLPNITTCSMADELGCAVDLWNSAKLLHELCSNKCPFECSQSVFHVDINYVEQSFLKTDHRGILGVQYWCLYFLNYFYFYPPNCENGFLFDEFDDKIYKYFYQVITQFSIRYDSLSYIKLDEEPKISGEELLGIIGGHLGLFLGMSLLSFVELVELFLLVFSQKALPEQNEIVLPASSIQSISKRTKEYIDRLNIVALPNLFRARYSCFSVIWLTLFMGSVSVCIFLVVNSVLEFTSYAVTTTVFYGKNEKIDYPAITLCNRHSLNSEYAYEIINNLTTFDAIHFPGLFGNYYLKN